METMIPRMEEIIMTLKQIAEKYNFRYEKNYKVDWNKKRDENNADVFIPLTEALLAKNTDGKDTVWIYRIDNSVFCLGNTDNLNLWLSDTRKDLTVDKLVEFIKDLNDWSENYGWSIPTRVIIDTEDWQEIAGICDAYEDERYCEI